MTKEERELVLKDICSRLPYGVIVQTTFNHLTLVNNAIAEKEEHEDVVLDIDNFSTIINIGEDIPKPYLRPLSSMTEEAFEYLNKMGVENSLRCIEIDDPRESFSLATKYCVEQLGYLYKHHYDVIGLIPSGHAIEVTKENNPYKE